MYISIVILIIAATVFQIIEGSLILRDRINAKGTTKFDQKTRLFNIVLTEFAIFSPLFSILIPILQFDNKDITIITFIGTSIICLGFILRYWSIIILGKYFRTTVEIDEGQKIIQKGPYKFIRHPSYSGMILFYIGYGLVSQNWLSLILTVILPTSALLYRINVEEKAFIEELGVEYQNYKSKTKKLIPGIW